MIDTNVADVGSTMPGVESTSGKKSLGANPVARIALRLGAILGLCAIGAIGLFAVIGLWSGAASATSPIDGLWLTSDRNAVVRVGSCGPRICGWIVRVSGRGSNAAARDSNNPNTGLRTRTIVGMPVLTGFSADGNQFSGGQVYDPTSGRSYRTTLSLNSDGSLNVTGCVLVFCQTKRWTRMR